MQITPMQRISLSELFWKYTDFIQDVRQNLKHSGFEHLNILNIWNIHETQNVQKA